MWPIYGYDWALSWLQKLFSKDENINNRGPSHAYLFSGPRHVGKTTLAFSFAQALLCTGDGGGNDNRYSAPPCGQCRSCRLFCNSHHPDFHWLQPTDKNGAVDREDGILRVDQAAQLITDAPLRPLEGHYKVFLIQDIHSANDSFANKLLKTLEEPPPHVILCLTAVDRAAVLPTLVSRCQQLELRPIGHESIAQALMDHWQVDEKRAKLLARLANGRLGWAVQQLLDTGSWDKRNERLEMLHSLAAANRVERLRFSEKLSANRDNQQLFGMLQLWMTWWRDVLLAQAGCLHACCNIDQVDTIQNYAQAIPAQRVQSYLQTLQQVEEYLHHTVNTRLALDVLVLKMPETGS